MKRAIASTLVLFLSLGAGGGVVVLGDEIKTKVEWVSGPQPPCENMVKEKSFVSVHYTGSIHESSATGEKDKVFDSSVPTGEPLDFHMNTGMVIKGFDALVGSCEGSKVVLIIPPEEGYGDTGAGDDIPGGATLKFELEILSVSDKAKPAPNIFEMIDADKDKRLDKEEVAAFFRMQGLDDTPEHIWTSEDKDGDGFISWEEFSGPKGAANEDDQAGGAEEQNQPEFDMEDGDDHYLDDEEEMNDVVEEGVNEDL